MRIARNRAKKDVGHGGLDEWFSGHGGSEGDATWGDWVAISPVKKKIKKELADGTVKEETVYPGDIIGPCGISEDPNWKKETGGGKDPLKCMPRQKAWDTPKKERAELAKEKMRAEKKDRGEGKSTTHTKTFKESRDIFAGENEPTDPDLWEESKDIAKSRYKKWPSAYAVGHALKIYKDEGGGWRKKKAGWWKSEGGGLIGDEPSDVMQVALDDVRNLYRDHPEINREPTLEELQEILEFVTGPEVSSGEILRTASVGKHSLPKLPYAYDALEPYISEETLRFHHDKHHKSYVDGLNEAEKAIAKARKEKDFERIPALNAAMQFNAGGHFLHTLYWESLTPEYEEPSQDLKKTIEEDFGSWEDFRSQMKESAVKVRGSGWGVLVSTPDGLRIVTVMNHENGVLWEGEVLLPIDAWEHAYYLDYQNDRAKHFEALFDNLVDWKKVEQRLQRSFEKRVASQHTLRNEVRKILAGRTASKSNKELTSEVLLSFLDSHGSKISTQKQAFDVAKKIKALWEAFSSKKEAWEDFKDMIGVRADSLLSALKELPSKIQNFVKKGKDALQKAGDYLVDKVPFFKIYFEARGKMPALNAYLLKLGDYLPPKISNALKSVAKSVTGIAEVLDDYVRKHPISLLAGKAVSAALFAVIWLNVTEISWDVPDILRGFSGGYTFVELLKSLPEAGIGLILSLLFPGLPSKYFLNAILPVTVALRLAWMVSHDYASWDKGSLEVHWDEMGVDQPEGLPEPG